LKKFCALAAEFYAATVCQTSAVTSVSRQWSWAHCGVCGNAITVPQSRH